MDLVLAGSSQTLPLLYMDEQVAVIVSLALKTHAEEKNSQMEESRQKTHFLGVESSNNPRAETSCKFRKSAPLASSTPTSSKKPPATPAPNSQSQAVISQPASRQFHCAQYELLCKISKSTPTPQTRSPRKATFEPAPTPK